MRRLGVTEGPEAIEMLIRLLDDPNTEVAGRAALTLGQRELPEVLPILLERLRTHPVGDIRASCALALDCYGEQCPTEPLVAALQDPDESVVRIVISALGYREDPALAEPIFPFLDDSRWNVRYGACQALTTLEVRDPRLTAALEELLQRPERFECFQSLDWVERALEAAEREPGDEEPEEPDPALVARAERLLREGDGAERKKAVRELRRFEASRARRPPSMH